MDFPTLRVAKMNECERHIEIVEAIDDHEDRIRYLEIRDTATSERLDNLIERVNKLVETIELFMSSVRKTAIATTTGFIMALFGFLLWYIQSL